MIKICELVVVCLKVFTVILLTLSFNPGVKNPLVTTGPIRQLQLSRRAAQAFVILRKSFFYNLKSKKGP